MPAVAFNRTEVGLKRGEVGGEIGGFLALPDGLVIGTLGDGETSALLVELVLEAAVHAGMCRRRGTGVQSVKNEGDTKRSSGGCARQGAANLRPGGLAVRG